MLKYIKIFFTGIIDIVIAIVASTLLLSVLFVITRNLPSANASVGVTDTKEPLYEITNDTSFK